MDFKINKQQLRVRHFALLIATLFFGCKYNDGAYGLYKRDTAAAIVSAIPADFSTLSIQQREVWFYNALQIPEPDRNYNGLQLHITEDYLNDTGHLILLNDSNNYWSAQLVNYKMIRNEARKMKALSYQRVSLGKPESGWKAFRKKLFELDVKSLQIENPLIDQFDTESVVMDVKTVDGQKYTHNNFADPYKSQNKNVRKVARIVNFIKEEFQIK